MWINQFLQVSFCIIADIIAKYIMCINMWKNERRFIMKFVCTVCGYVYEGDAAPSSTFLNLSAPAWQIGHSAGAASPS